MLVSGMIQRMGREEDKVPTMQRNSGVWLDDKQLVATSGTDSRSSALSLGYAPSL